MSGMYGIYMHQTNCHACLLALFIVQEGRWTMNEYHAYVSIKSFILVIFSCQSKQNSVATLREFWNIIKACKDRMYLFALTNMIQKFEAIAWRGIRDS